MKTSDFSYELPKELIATFPVSPRDHARLLIDAAPLTHIPFYDIIHHFGPDDCLVFNNTKVIKARIHIQNERTHRSHEALFQFLNPEANAVFMLDQTKKCQEGDVFSFKGQFKACLLKKEGYHCHFSIPKSENLLQFLDEFGLVPLPPYIHRDIQNETDQIHYQTVYAKHLGAVAAPTAGLHFTQEILHALKKKGVRFVEVTLHVGLGTFLPVKEIHIQDHHMHAEYIELSESSAHALNAQRSFHKPITCVGTTSLRVLESCFDKHTGFFPFKGHTSIFIHPPRLVLSCQKLLTNFHQSESTLLMLVSAFSGLKHIQHLYQTALKNRLRFLSFGDCMLLHNSHIK